MEGAAARSRGSGQRPEREADQGLCSIDHLDALGPLLTVDGVPGASQASPTAPTRAMMRIEPSSPAWQDHAMQSLARLLPVLCAAALSAAEPAPAPAPAPAVNPIPPPAVKPTTPAATAPATPLPAATSPKA